MTLSCSGGDNANLIEVGDWRARVAKAKISRAILLSTCIPLHATMLATVLTLLYTFAPHLQAKADAEAE